VIFVDTSFFFPLLSANDRDHPRVREVFEVLPDARLRVSFGDGTAGEVEMEAFLQGPGVVGTVFEPLRDPELLARAVVVSGAVQWPNGADLAPDAM
jgi:hypothetical protein